MQDGGKCTFKIEFDSFKLNFSRPGKESRLADHFPSTILTGIHMDWEACMCIRIFLSSTIFISYSMCTHCHFPGILNQIELKVSISVIYLKMYAITKFSSPYFRKKIQYRASISLNSGHLGRPDYEITYQPKSFLRKLLTFSSLNPKSIFFSFLEIIHWISVTARRYSAFLFKIWCPPPLIYLHYFIEILYGVPRE